MYRLKVEDPALDFPVYGRKMAHEDKARDAMNEVAMSGVLSANTVITVQKKTGWFGWEDVTTTFV